MENLTLFKSKNFGSGFFLLVGLLIFTATTLSAQNGFSEPFEKSMNERQSPEMVIKAIGVKPGMTVGEVGAGRGRFTVFLAAETGKSGKVLANDIDEISLAYLRGRCRRLGLDNVETIVGEMNDPLFPEKSLDMAIMVLVYHMIESPDDLLKNIKGDLKPGASLVILDPRDEEIDKEFGIDRSDPAKKVPAIKERIEKSARVAGYVISKTETFLPRDYIFILTPIEATQKKSAGDLIRETIITNGIDASRITFNKIKMDTAQFDLSEKMFRILGSEFIGSRSYPESLAVLNMGVELYPKSSSLYGEIGEVYVATGDKENSKKYFKLYLENGPDSLNADNYMQNFDAIYEQLRPHE